MGCGVEVEVEEEEEAGLWMAETGERWGGWGWSCSEARRWGGVDLVLLASLTSLSWALRCGEREARSSLEQGHKTMATLSIYASICEPTQWGS